MSDQPRIPTSAPPEPPKNDWVERIPPGRPVEYLIFSKAVWGPHTHWTGHRTIQCDRDDANGRTCEKCENGMTRRWKGYLHVWSYAKREEVFIELTARCVRQLHAQVDDTENLRGLKIIVSRSSMARNSRLCCKVLTRSSGAMRQEKDPQPVLLKLWKYGFAA